MSIPGATPAAARTRSSGPRDQSVPAATQANLGDRARRAPHGRMTDGPCNWEFCPSIASITRITQTVITPVQAAGRSRDRSCNEGSDDSNGSGGAPRACRCPLALPGAPRLGLLTARARKGLAPTTCIQKTGLGALWLVACANPLGGYRGHAHLHDGFRCEQIAILQRRAFVKTSLHPVREFILLSAVCQGKAGQVRAGQVKSAAACRCMQMQVTLTRSRGRTWRGASTACSLQA
jgi:hypothetical protein